MGAVQIVPLETDVQWETFTEGGQRLADGAVIGHSAGEPELQRLMGALLDGWQKKKLGRKSL